MGTNVKPIPDGCHSVTPYLIVADVVRALEFLQVLFWGLQDLPDPGHLWHLATSKEDLSMDEIQKRTAAFCGQ